MLNPSRTLNHHLLYIDKEFYTLITVIIDIPTIYQKLIVLNLRRPSHKLKHIYEKSFSFILLLNNQNQKLYFEIHFSSIKHRTVNYYFHDYTLFLYFIQVFLIYQCPKMVCYF